MTVRNFPVDFHWCSLILIHQVWVISNCICGNADPLLSQPGTTRALSRSGLWRSYQTLLSVSCRISGNCGSLMLTAACLVRYVCVQMSVQRKFWFDKIKGWHATCILSDRLGRSRVRWRSWRRTPGRDRITLKWVTGLPCAWTSTVMKWNKAPLL